MRLTVLAYLKKAGQTLMLHRNKRKDDHHKGKWNGLGGKFEAGESPEMCLRREVYEESNLKVEKATLRGFITFPLFDAEDDWYVFVYTVEAFSGTLKSSPEGELHWIDDDKLLDLNLWEGDKVFIPWLAQDKFFSAVFYYDTKGDFKNYEVVFY